MFLVFLIDVVPFFLFFFLNPFQKFKKIPFPYTTSCCCISSQRSLAPFLSARTPSPLGKVIVLTTRNFFSFGTAKLYLFISPSKSFSKFFRVFFIPSSPS